MAAGKQASPLRAVVEGEVAAPKSVTEAAENGTHRELLVALRTRIAKTVADPTCPPRDLAALSKRLTDMAKEIEEIDLRAKEEADEDAAKPDEDWDASAI